MRRPGSGVVRFGAEADPASGEMGDCASSDMTKKAHRTGTRGIDQMGLVMEYP